MDIVGIGIGSIYTILNKHNGVHRVWDNVIIDNLIDTGSLLDGHR